MGKFLRGDRFKWITTAFVDSASCFFSYSIDCKNRSFLKWRIEECGCRMWKVMIRKENVSLEIQFFLQLISNPYFLAQPWFHCPSKTPKYLRTSSSISINYSIKFDEWRLIKIDVFDLINADSFEFKCSLNSKSRKALIVLNSRKALLLSGKDCNSVL